MVGACGWNQHTDKQSVSECRPRSVGHALLVMPAHWTHSMQESSQAATDNYHNECGVLETHTHTHKRLLQKISHKQIQRRLFLKNPISWASGFDMWSTQAPPPPPSTEGGRHYLAFSTVRIMKSPEQELNNACSNVQKSGIFLNAEILLQDATGHSCNCPVSVSQGVSCADLVASLNNAWWKLQFALSGGASSQFCVADGSP